MKFDTYTAKIPTWALCYLINGDEIVSGTDEQNREDTALIENWLRVNGFDGYTIFSPINDESYFSASPEFGLPCDVIECEIHIPDENENL